VSLVQGHTAHTNSEKARDMVAAQLEWYPAVYEEHHAVPVSLRPVTLAPVTSAHAECS
jgi:hypothetical protein